jgi:hypothetical protein
MSMIPEIEDESVYRIGAKITTKQAAALLQVTPRRVRQLIEEGYIERAGRDQVILDDAVHGYILFLRGDLW